MMVTLQKKYLMLAAVLASLIPDCTPKTTPGTNSIDLKSSDCSGQNLTHTVVYEGNSTAFLRANNGQSVQWQVMPSSVTKNRLKNITNYDDTPTSEFTNTYQVSGSQLTIPRATVDNQTGYSNYSTAGLYIMNIKNSNCSTAANLIVIQSRLSCAYNASNPLKLTCSVIFAESTAQPCNAVFIWTNSGGLQVKKETPIPKQIDPYVKIAQSQLSITSSDTTTYKCQLTYASPSSSPLAYVASKAPDFSAVCSVARS